MIRKKHVCKQHINRKSGWAGHKRRNQYCPLSVFFTWQSSGTVSYTHLTGFACRILGFFYRIFLSRTIGAEGLGLYNMVHPVFGICFALCAGSIQTAVSQAVASNVERGRAAFKAGLVISLTMAVFLGCIIWNFGDFLAVNLLMEERCAPLLPCLLYTSRCV